MRVKPWTTPDNVKVANFPRPISFPRRRQWELVGLLAEVKGSDFLSASRLDNKCDIEYE